jgi:hypothetical protein
MMAAAMNAGTGTGIVGFIVKPTTMTPSVPSASVSFGFPGLLSSFESFLIFARPRRGGALEFLGLPLEAGADWLAYLVSSSTRGVGDLVVINSFIVADTSALEFHANVLDQSQGVLI